MGDLLSYVDYLLLLCNHSSAQMWSRDNKSIGRFAFSQKFQIVFPEISSGGRNSIFYDF